jgi:hypothetical protein
MESILLAFSSAVWLGILTSISPCPLATNIAAISYIGRRLDSPRLVLVAGLLYAAGRTLAYVALASLLVAGAFSVPELSRFLQKYMNQILGPLLVLAGMFLLNLLSYTGSGSRIAESLQNRISKWGWWGSLPLGFLFALSFCPVSAALFFGSLIPLCLEANSSISLPLGYGIGTALPVLVVGFVVALSVGSIGKVFAVMTRLEKRARRITGLIFILVGLYLSLKYIFNIPLP